MAQALATGEALRDEEILIEWPDGSRLVALASIEPVRDAEGRILGAVNVFRDNTAQHRERALLQALPVGRHRIEEQLRNSEARYRAVFDNAPVSFWELDLSGVLDYSTTIHSQGLTHLGPYLPAQP